MARTRTSGITVDADGGRVICKQVLGSTIYHRIGQVSQEEAEAWLAGAIERKKLERTRGTRPRVTFREGGIRYLTENAGLASIDEAAWHLELLDPWVGGLPLDEICDEALQPFVDHRLQSVTRTTVNRSLELARSICNLAARKWRHPNRMTWLETAPLISIEKDKDARRAYPLSWEEQRYLFRELPADPNAQMALYKVNTGTREQEVCGLEWEWEVRVPELGTSVFVIPGDRVKNREDRLVVHNDVAMSVIEARRGIHPRYVFTYRGDRLGYMNNTAWQNGRRDAAAKWQEEKGKPAPIGFARVRVHDLKHTFGRRLRAAGVPEETRKVLLGHKNGDITVHYSGAEIAELVAAVNRIDASRETPAITLLRAA